MAVFVQSKTEGFRRCGVPHSAKGKEFPDGFFTGDQLVELNNDPEIIMVAGVEDEEDTLAGGSDDTTKSKESENENTDADGFGVQLGDGSAVAGDETQTADLDGTGTEEEGQAVAEDLLGAARTAVAAGDTIKSGAPDITALETILGRDVSAAERDLAWDAIQAVENNA